MTNIVYIKTVALEPIIIRMHVQVADRCMTNIVYIKTVVLEPVVTRPFEPYLPLLSTPTPSARFRVFTVGRGWHWRPRIRSVDPFEFCLVS
jgi:hypothetical protein